MRDKELYAQILGIKSPWQVTGVDLNVPEGEVTVQVEQEEGVRSLSYKHLVGFRPLVQFVPLPCCCSALIRS